MEPYIKNFLDYYFLDLHKEVFEPFIDSPMKQFMSLYFVFMDYEMAHMLGIDYSDTFDLSMKWHEELDSSGK